MKQWTTLQLPLAAGLDTSGDDRAASPPGFDVLKDAEFEEPGGLQTRKPFASLGPSGGTDIFGGGTLANMRRIVENGNELLCFTKDSLYSWSTGASKWVLRGTHLAVKVTERPVCATTGDQVDCDRAELNGTIIYAWTDNAVVYVAAQDKKTGAIIRGPVAATGGQSRPRLVALDTKILLFVATGAAELAVAAIDPADPLNVTLDAAHLTVVLAAPFFNLEYDVTRVLGADTAIVGARRIVTTSYSIIKVTAGLTITASTKGRTCTGPIAVSSTPTGASVQVIRANGANVQGDFITVSSLADVTTGQAIGTSTTGPISQIAAAHRSVTDSSQYRCYVFWSEDATDDASAALWPSKYNWVDTGGTLGTQAVFVSRLGIASRAFDYNGQVYVWGAFASTSAVGAARVALQNTYFLYRDDAFLAAKAAATRAGGFSPSEGHLPGVALTDGTTTFSWCGTTRRVIETGSNHSGYAARVPLDVGFTFDSNEARRTARLGSTMYVSGGEILQYDGSGLYEVGFHVYPWNMTASRASAGNLADALYAYKSTWRWDNGRGEIERSTSATTVQFTVAATGKVSVATVGLDITHKTLHQPAVEIWRTQGNPTADSPFNLVTSKNPATTSNPNRYLVNQSGVGFVTTLDDNLADADAAILEVHPENGSILENLAPPAASIIIATDDRLFLAGVSGDPDRVWYSKQRGDGEVAAFHDALTVNVPREGGAITALAFLNETLVVFREHAIYLLPGVGFDNAGGGQNFGPATRVPGDIGATNMESVVLTSSGLVFKSAKGFYRLGTRFDCEYIGFQVNEFDADDVYSAHIVKTQHQIRFVTNHRMLVFDYRVGQWVEWTVSDGLHATIWNGQYLYLSATGVKYQLTTYVGVNYGIAAELAWIKLNDLQGAGSVRWLMLLGEFRGNHLLRVQLARDYQRDATGWAWYQNEVITPSPAIVGGPEQVRISPRIPKCEAIKVRISVIGSETEVPGVYGTAGNEACKLTGLALQVGIDQGSLFKWLPASQKV